MRRAAIFSLALLLGWASVTAWAQRKPKEEETGVRSVEGVVTDPEGNVVEGAVVQLKNTKTLQVRSYITGKNGAYSFHGLSQNVDYELRAEHQGRSSDVRTLSVFDSRRRAVINLRLRNP